ncbi:MAG: BatA domain-containing protein [Planctomycetes bacterium]|nr:BatA domain-containing protein [Planctomycetota bacterium]
MGAFLAQFFMNPLFLVGVGSAAVPVVIHLIHRRKAPKVRFSTLRFLRVSNERTARRRRLQNLFLLLLRSLICALLAIALAQPFLAASGWADGPVTAVIVLDNSMSTSAEDEGRAKFGVAKETAMDVLRELGGKATVALLLSNPPGDYSAALTNDPSVIEKNILGSSVSAGRASLPATIAKAREILEESAVPNRQIIALSDMQKNSWSTADTPPDGKTLSKMPVVIIGCGSKDTSNAAVTDVAVRAGSRVEGEPMSIEARLLSFAPKAVSQTATLYVDGQARDRRRITLAPNVPVAVSFTYTFTRPGVHHGQVAIEDDRLKADNVRSFTVSIQRQLQVLIVQDEKSAVEFMDSSFYLAKALDPLGGDAAVRSPIRPARVLTASAESEKLSDYDAVCLVDVARIGPGLARMLKEYVREGGGLIVFAGDNADLRHYNAVLADPADALVAAELGQVLGNADDHTQFHSITDVDYSHPLLERFKGENIFNDVRVFQYVSARVAGRSAASLIGLPDGSPLLIENRYGNGTALMFTCSATTDWSNLPLKGAFLPLIHEIVHYVSREEMVKESYLVGSPVRLAFPEVREALPVEITSPAGDDHKLETAPGGAVNAAVFDLTDRPGVYSWRAAGRTGAFAVNPDTRESDLHRSDEAEVRGISRLEDVHVVSSTDEMRETLKRLREGLPLLDYFFLLVLVIAVFECFFSNWLTPSAPAEVRKNKLGIVTTSAHGEA